MGKPAFLIDQPPEIEPKCSHFGQCGGCRFQHFTYATQLKQKEQYVTTLFASLNPQCMPILSCDSPWEYRNKMEFSFSQSKAGDRFLGLMMRRNRVITLDECHLTHSWFIDVLKAVYQWWKSTDLQAYHHHKDTGSLRTLTLREGIGTGEKMAILTISGHPDYPFHSLQEKSFTQSLLEICPLNSIILRKQIIQKKQPTRFESTILHGEDHFWESLSNELRLKIRAPSFFQPNTIQATKLYHRAIELANLNPDETVFDLYCGIGAIGMLVAKKVKEVIGIELVPESIEDANLNKAINGISNITFIAADVGEILADSTLPKPTTIFVDPPRVGLSPQAIEHLVALAPQKIVYISCNPKSQVENIKELIEKGYQLITIQPIDQFPHTPHIESIAILHKTSA